MLVKAAPGLQVPMENNPREHITDSNPIDVPDTAYYRRLLDPSEGSLVEAQVGRKKGGDQ